MGAQPQDHSTTVSHTPPSSGPSDEPATKSHKPGPHRRERSRKGSSSPPTRKAIGSQIPREPTKEDLEIDYSHECYYFNGEESIYRPHHGTFGILGNLKAIKKDQFGRTLAVPKHYGFCGKDDSARENGDVVWDYDRQEYVIIPERQPQGTSSGNPSQVLNWDHASNKHKQSASEPEPFQDPDLPSHKGSNGRRAHSESSAQSAPKRYIFLVNEHLYDLAPPHRAPATVLAETTSKGNVQRKNGTTSQQKYKASFKPLQNLHDETPQIVDPFHDRHGFPENLIDPALRSENLHQVDSISTPPLTNDSGSNSVSSRASLLTPPPELGYPRTHSHTRGDGSEDSLSSLFSAANLPTPPRTPFVPHQFMQNAIFEPAHDSFGSFSAEPLSAIATRTLEEELDWSALFGEDSFSHAQLHMRFPCAHGDLGPLIPACVDDAHRYSMYQSNVRTASGGSVNMV